MSEGSYIETLKAAISEPRRHLYRNPEGPAALVSKTAKALICSRNGSVFSLDVEGGEILWEYKVSDPITATAYVDEHSRLETEPSDLRDRLACVCSSSGRIHVLRINSNAKQAKLCDGGIPQCQMVREYAVIDVPGDIFSSPVMIGGRIFVGCRDDHVHCISLVT